MNTLKLDAPEGKVIGPAGVRVRDPFACGPRPSSRGVLLSEDSVETELKIGDEEREGRAAGRVDPAGEQETRAEAATVAPDNPFARGLEPIYAGAVRLLRWNNSSASGMTATASIIDDSHFMIHPLKGLSAATDPEKMNGQRLYVALSTLESEQEGDPLYQGDAILLWWSDDCRHGMKFTIRFREGPDGAGSVHPCFGMAAGSKNGQMLTIALWAIEDDEEIEDPRPKRQRRAFTDLTPTQQSQILCRDTRFQEWLARCLRSRRVNIDINELRTLYRRDPVYFAELVVKDWCGIVSRAELSREEEPMSKWKAILKEYQARKY